jgi:catechol 2,3-dioxygenase-like lactoylglutathione lyase family enzyme
MATDALAVERVDFISVPTRDVERAIAFYRDVLGLEVRERSPGEAEASNVTLSFWNPEADGEEFAPNVAGVALRVADVEAPCAAFAEAGGEVVGIVDSGVCHMGFCKDPDGNTLILHRRYAGFAN